MKCLLSSCLTIAAIALVAPRPAGAAALIINDALPDPNIAFSLNDFEGGFFLDGVLVQEGLNNPQTVTVSEGDALTGPIVHSFSADWITGALVPTSAVIAFSEGGIPPSEGVSDILTYTYSPGPLGGHLVGTFESDLDPGLLPLPPGATVIPGERFDFSNGNITAIATSDLPEPSSLAVIAAGLLGFGMIRRRRKQM